MSVVMAMRAVRRVERVRERRENGLCVGGEVSEGFSGKG